MSRKPFDFRTRRKIRRLIEQSSLGCALSDSVEDTAIFLATFTKWNTRDRLAFASHFSLEERGARQSIDLDALRHAVMQGISAHAIIVFSENFAGTRTERHDAITVFLDKYRREHQRS